MGRQIKLKKLYFCKPVNSKLHASVSESTMYYSIHKPIVKHLTYQEDTRAGGFIAAGKYVAGGNYNK